MHGCHTLSLCSGLGCVRGGAGGGTQPAFVLVIVMYASTAAAARSSQNTTVVSLPKHTRSHDFLQPRVGAEEVGVVARLDMTYPCMHMSDQLCMPIVASQASNISATLSLTPKEERNIAIRRACCPSGPRIVVKFSPATGPPQHKAGHQKLYRFGTHDMQAVLAPELSQYASWILTEHGGLSSVSCTVLKRPPFVPCR